MVFVSKLRGYIVIIWRRNIQRNIDKVKKTISKIDEPPKNGVRKVVFLIEVDFSNSAVIYLKKM